VIKKQKEKLRTLEERGKTSGTYQRTVEPWTDTDDISFRREVESRYRDRTPPQALDEKLEMQRVRRPEMETWAQKELGKPLPEIEEWAIDFILWYRRMVERNRVHMRWLDYCLCGARGKLPPIRSDIESEITCQDCQSIFRRKIGSRPD
jgi:hypothetical protein